MDTNRLIRLTVAGWGLVLSWIFHLWILGAYVPIQTVLSGAVAPLVVGLMVGPFLGFLISSVAAFVVRLYLGGSIQFDIPSEKRFRFVEALQRLMPEVRIELMDSLNKWPPNLGDNSESRWRRFKSRRQDRSYSDDFEPYFNLLYHTRAPATLIEYTTRRWTIYWMSLNSASAMLIGAVVALLTAGDFWNRRLALCHVLLEVLIVIVVVAVSSRLRHLPREIGDVAQLWLYSEAQS